jgi:enolase
MAQIDGTVNWSAVGANAAVAVSMAVCRAAAAARRIPLYRHIADLCHVTQPALPMPMVNILSGGLHARLAMDLQDFLIVPVGATDYDQALEWIWRVRTAASTVAERRGLSTLLADEGGISPGCASVVEGFSLMDEIIACSGLEPGGQVAVAIDVAANGLLRTDGAYHFAREGVVRDASAITALLNDCVRRFPVCSIEDPLADEDWAGWSALSAGLVDVQLVGDDLLSTQPARIARAAAAGIANAALIKINQNGSLSGTLEAMRVTRDAGYRTIVSARSGETEDDFIADLAVGTAAGQIKIGSMRCSERQSKYNRLAWITADDDRLPLTNPFAKRTPDPRDVRRDARGARRKEL